MYKKKDIQDMIDEVYNEYNMYDIVTSRKLVRRLIKKFDIEDSVSLRMMAGKKLRSEYEKGNLEIAYRRKVMVYRVVNKSKGVDESDSVGQQGEKVDRVI